MESSEGPSRVALDPLHESFLPQEHALYRPRHSPRQRTALITAVVYLCLPALLLVVGVRPEEFENRRLAAFPSGWDLFTGLDEWAADHLPFRKEAVEASGAISRGVFGEQPRFDRRPTEVAGPVQTQPKDPSLDRPDPTSYVEVLEGKDDWLYLGGDVKGACSPKTPTDDVLDRLARLRTAVEASGRKFVLVVAPSKTTVVTEYLPAKYYGKECLTKARDHFWAGVDDKRVDAIDLRDDLAAEAKRLGHPVYTKNDTHWNHDGALVMIRAVADAVRPGTTRTWQVDPARKIDREGDLARLLGRTASDQYQAYDLKPDGSTVCSRPVTGDERKPQRFTQARVPGVVEAKVGWIGDSFTFAAPSYLVAGYTDVTVQHVSGVTADAGQVARMLADTDVVVVEAAERNLLDGTNPILTPAVLDAIGGELAKKPRR
ncbi:hypothetical protein GCM10022243_28450 [Saccharothrix violaceirubra]